MDPTWLTPDLHALPVAPLKSYVGSRSPTEYRAVIDQFELTTCERYRKRDVDGIAGDETFCNFFVHDVLAAMGVTIKWPLKANAFKAYFEQEPFWDRVSGWVARAMANAGYPTVAVWENPLGPHGHVAMVVPSRNELDKSNTFIAQAGAINFVYGRVEQGFGNRPVTYFVHQ